MSELTAERARALLDYDPMTGVLTWKHRTPDMFTSGRNNTAEGCCARWNSIYAGVEAGSRYSAPDKKTGYISLHIVGFGNLKAHRIIWLMMTGEWPKGLVDHRDLDGYNNRWLNLRDATNAQNKANCGAYRNNTTGYKGVYKTKQSGKYLAKIRDGKKLISLGTFYDPEIANAKYGVAAEELRGEFARAV